MENGSVSLRVFDLRPWMDSGNWRAVLPLLPQERQARILSCRQEEDRVRLAGAGYLLRQSLLAAGVPASEQIFETNAWGKPALCSGNVSFSISHAGFYAVCAVGPSPLGADIEAPRISMDLAARCFHPQELDFLKSLSIAQHPDAMLRIWTAKEAYMKYLGRGLLLPLDAFRVELTQSGACLYQSDRPLPERLHEYALGDCRLCLCSCTSRPELLLFTP